MKKEEIFKYVTEGRGETLYRISLPNGNIKMLTEGSSIVWDENDNDTIKKWNAEYSSWEEWWQKFTINKD
jgi:hypothetical protein